MTTATAKPSFSRFCLPALCLLLGLLLGFLMDYYHGRGFGKALFVIELTDNEKYVALTASFCASLFFLKRKAKNPPHSSLLVQHSFKALASLVILAFFSYCRMPSSARNAVFKLGMTSFLREFPEEAATLKKLLIENKPDAARALPYDSSYPQIGDSWRARISLFSIVYSKRCSTLIIHGHERYIVAIFLDRMDQATAKKVIIEDVSKASAFTSRPLFSATVFGLTLVWEDIA